MREFLNRFKTHLTEMCVEFESNVASTFQMNQLLRENEATLCANYSAKNLDSEEYKVFESARNETLINSVNSLTTMMKNPFEIMLRWLKFEILDLEAIIEAISQKNEMERRKTNRIAQ
jgi:hypothetical protein